MVEALFDSDFTGQKYTKQDFIRLIEHRIRKDLRISKAIDLKQRYFIKKTEKITSQLLFQILKNIFPDKFQLNYSDEKAEGEIELNVECLEEFITKRLNFFFEKQNENLLNEIITPLRVITRHEIMQLSEIFEIKGEEPPSTHEFIEAMQKKYSQTKMSFLKSFDFIAKLMG